MPRTGRALPDPLVAPAAGSAMPSTAICILAPRAIDLGTCTTARMSIFPLAVTTQAGRHCGVPAALDCAARWSAAAAVRVVGAGVPVPPGPGTVPDVSVGLGAGVLG